MTQIPPITLNLSAEDLAAIEGAVQVLQEKLLPGLITLSVQDRKEILKLGDKTLAFVRKALQHARENPAFQPPFGDLAEMERELALLDLIGGLQRPLSRVVDGLDDTGSGVGGNLYAYGLAVYQTVKLAAKNRLPGAQAAADDLGQRFQSRSSHSTASTTAAPSQNPS